MPRRSKGGRIDLKANPGGIHWFPNVLIHHSSMEDAVIREGRETRYQIEQEFHHDANKYLDHVYEAQKKHGDRLVRRQPKLLKTREAG